LGGQGDEVADVDAVDGGGASARRARLRLPASVTRFGLVYVLVAVWIAAVIVLPSRPLPEVRAAVNGPAAGEEGPSLVPGATEDTLPADPTATTAGPGGGGGATPGVGPTGTGVTKGGVPCAVGVRQVPGDSYSLPCIPAFTGANGGATARGITATTIRIVRRSFPDSANSQAVDAVVAQAGGATHATVRATREVMLKEFERKYELYGRHVEWVDFESRFGNDTQETQGRGREGACLDAEVVANELHAFAVTGDRAAVSKPFADCAAQRGVVVLDGASYASEKFYRDRHPYAWAFITSCDRINYQVGEYVGKRLVNRPAKYAGDADMAKQTRKFGIYTPVSDGEDDSCSKIYDAMTAKYHFGSTSTYRYVLDVSRFPDEAARGAIQLKRDGVTSVIMACDPISMIFLSQSATSQGWHPEWIVIGIILTDTDNAARLYDQGQVDGHMFGMSYLGATSKILGPNGEPGRMYKKLTGQTIPAGTEGQFYVMTHIYNLLQAAGPRITPASLGAGAFTIPSNTGAPDYAAGYWSFRDGDDGTPGAHDHTLVDDAREVYWRGDVRSTADGKAGTYIATYDGKRFRNGEWPAEDPPVYP
jgi:hypothetical protein